MTTMYYLNIYNAEVNSWVSSLHIITNHFHKRFPSHKLLSNLDSMWTLTFI